MILMCNILQLLNLWNQIDKIKQVPEMLMNDDDDDDGCRIFQMGPAHQKLGEPT